MKIVVVGGTGQVGRQLIRLLTAEGHEAVAASPSTGINTITGEGLAGALAGAQTVVDVTNAPVWGDDEVLAFFTASTGNLLEAGRAAGVRHHIALTIVGADRNPGSGYQRAKVAQEQLIVASGVPYTILRATQFYSFLGTIADAATVDGAVHAPAAAFQPVAVEDVAAALAEAATGAPANAVVDLAGPEKLPMTEFLSRFLDATGDTRKVIEDAAATYFGAPLTDESLVPTGNHAERIGALSFAGWLSRPEGAR
ncbi:SDR family oxidoreductase [Actinoplanes sp. KI2]|uniref:SDR family oxidoreductase n=1 Tax=Actinoplanes sp. KI2 TaxID=2983315 RepID=UPI0021D58DBB|nr:SDR family oxidoreductase [Actinoplanes sp. KI2]MCU7727629.1 SDR family oxidoreductase [Actinoplanes sp. KI2]